MEYKVVTVPAEWKPAPRVCRCCLSEGCYKDISTEYYWLGEKEMYSQMLKECFDLTISLSEAAGSSRLICEVCITRLRDASNFKKQVINSEKRFAEHLRSGASLSVVEAQETPVILDIKVEGVKDEAAISDDDPDPVDDDIADPDYDESDDLPLKFEVQKKESMTELSFGDEIPALNTSETTIKKVSSKTKDKSALKKLKMNKRELTIKPVKASTSKKKDKVAKTKVKAAKPGAKKGVGKKREVNLKSELLHSDADAARPYAKADNQAKIRERTCQKNASLIIQNSYVVPFKWHRTEFQCFCCTLKHTDRHIIRQHMLETHSDKDLTNFLNNSLPYDSVKVDITRVDCKRCSERVESLDELKTHLDRAHNIKMSSKYGFGVIAFKFDLDDFTCHLCNSQFNVFTTLNNHMNTHYQHFICETCGKSFATNKRLAAHALQHEVGTFPCHDCDDAVFVTRKARLNHRLQHHKMSPQYKCPQCDQIFKSYLDRNKHRRSVHNETSLEYKCPMCPKVFALSGKRTYHIKQVHIREKNHACTMCDWKFFSKNELKEHMVKHTGERVHQCDVCKKAYARKHTLREHMRIHSDDRRYVCSICASAYVQNCSLKNHMRSHHPEVAELMYPSRTKAEYVQPDTAPLAT